MLEIFTNSPKYTCTLEELTQEQRVICSIVRPFDEATLAYIKYLIHTFGNELVVLTSQPISIATFRANLLDHELEHLTCALDRSGEVYQTITQGKIKNRPIEWIKRFWMFQTVVQHGEVQFFHAQPYENRIDAAKRSITGDQMREIFSNKKVDVLKMMLGTPEKMLYDQNSIAEFLQKDGVQVNDIAILKPLFYHEVWPSNKLLTYLKNTV